MAGTALTGWSVFRDLCRVLGGQDSSALPGCLEAGQFPHLLRMAQAQDVVPALAVRCDERGLDGLSLGAEGAETLEQALLDNSKRNMRLCAQAVKLARRLNSAGITPLFLKGTALLLGPGGGNLGFRKQVDIDLVVRPDQLEAAGDALLDDGYRFCSFPDGVTAVPVEPGDTANAMQLRAAHHHLPALLKADYPATVELHRHFLPARFQRGNPLASLFDSARRIDSHEAAFFVPSAEYQLIHLTLGKFVHDGHLARRAFPVREACDVIRILEDAGEAIDRQLLARRCGDRFALFLALVSELMAYRSSTYAGESVDASGYVGMMRRRHESAGVRRLLDVNARLQYLAAALLYAPAKLPAYLRRMRSPG